VLTFRGTRSLDELTGVASLSCQSAQLALSARADGEASRAEAAKGRLHTVSCARCRDFASAITEQRESLSMLVPPAAAELSPRWGRGGASTQVTGRELPEAAERRAEPRRSDAQ
jgi:hypothetical protein